MHIDGHVFEQGRTLYVRDGVAQYGCEVELSGSEASCLTIELDYLLQVTQERQLVIAARKELSEAIAKAEFRTPVCPIYQNVDALPHTDSDEIRRNLLMQLTSPVRWTQTMKNMLADGADSFTEVGPGTGLQGLAKKIAPEGTEISGIA